MSIFQLSVFKKEISLQKICKTHILHRVVDLPNWTFPSLKVPLIITKILIIPFLKIFFFKQKKGCFQRLLYAYCKCLRILNEFKMASTSGDRKSCPQSPRFSQNFITAMLDLRACMQKLHSSMDCATSLFKTNSCTLRLRIDFFLAWMKARVHASFLQSWFHAYHFSHYTSIFTV